MVFTFGEVSRTGKLKRTLPTGVSVAIVQRITPAVSRRMLSTPGSIFVKFVTVEKKLRTTGSGALISSLSLNEDLMRNMEQLAVVSCQLAVVSSQLRRTILFHAFCGRPDVSSYQQRVHQRWRALRSSKE